MNIVPRVNTPLERASTKSALIAALGAEGLQADTDSVALLSALIWVETGAGQKCQNHNVGNITAGSSFSGNAWRPPWFEVDENSSERNRELHELMQRGRAPSAFRAYDSLSQGMRDFVHQLRFTFPEVINGARTGDPEAFRSALSLKYSRDYENREVTRTFASFMRDFGGSPKVPAAGALPSSPPASGSGLQSSLPVLRHGAEGSAVELWAVLVGAERVTRMGAALVARTLAWQSSRGLKPDAIVGPLTWGKALDELAALRGHI